MGPLALFQVVICEMIYQTMHLPLSSNFSSFCLADIPSKDFFLEMEFAFEVSGNMMKGFIDGVFLFDKKIYILDWKTNYLGDKSSDYLSDKMAVVMEEQGYFLQAAIYSEALKRYLIQLDVSERSLSFGGAFYLFLRGNAAFYFLPDLSLLSGIEKGEMIRCS
jgi:exodeoxyribonuclease V beta subunit